jgi:hypothetical protein
MSKGTEMDMATAVKERPMIFSGPMVKALLEDRKTQTRRVVTPQPFKSDHDPEMWLRSRGRRSYNSNCRHEEVRNRHTGEVLSERQYYLPLEDWLAEQCPYGQPGDRLWVRETFRRSSFTDQGDSIRRAVEYRADGAKMHHSSHLVTELRSWVWLSPIHMPRWAARIILEITEVRVERVQEIGEADAIAEGFNPLDTGSGVSAREQFATLWDQINGRRADWITNPWVWVIGFRRLSP